ncbi:ExbD/TolR family protein, partial [Aurantibacter sp.]|uniref:ExbD/TolR family protein n=1 Tax=Aurantibacter sp. TaxID=2807103 RepID=UPI0035C8738E
MAKRSAPEVNAGSMADIAFLLLIFFLVTTTIEVDSGINSKLPPVTDEVPPIKKQKNIFTVQMAADGQLLVEDELMDIKDLREAALEFIDNGGGQGDAKCNYCNGKKDPKSSDNPKAAVISITHVRGTEYGPFITAYDQLAGAYTTLRNKYAQRKYNRTFEDMEASIKNSRSPEYLSEKLKAKITEVK